MTSKTEREKAKEIVDYWTENMLHVFMKCLQMPTKPKWKFNLETKRHVHGCLESAFHQAVLEERKKNAETCKKHERVHMTNALPCGGPPCCGEEIAKQIMKERK